MLFFIIMKSINIAFSSVRMGVRTSKFGLLLAVLAALLLSSCGKGLWVQPFYPKDALYEQSIVINEVLPSNRTGLAATDGKTLGWVEIKNISDESVSLKNCWLIYDRQTITKEDSIAGKSDMWKSDRKADCLDDVTLEPGQCLLVYDRAIIVNDGEPRLQYDAAEHNVDLNLSPKSGHLQLVSSDNTLLSEVEYGSMNPDEALRRLNNGAYERSYMLTPGFENSQAGYEEYNQLLESQRTGPLRVWEVMSKNGEADSWVEIKNVSNADVNLAEYTLTTKPKKPEMWQMPDLALAPGQIYTVQLAGKKAGGKGKAGKGGKKKGGKKKGKKAKAAEGAVPQAQSPAATAAVAGTPNADEAAPAKAEKAAPNDTVKGKKGKKDGKKKGKKNKKKKKNKDALAAAPDATPAATAPNGGKAEPTKEARPVRRGNINGDKADFKLDDAETVLLMKGGKMVDGVCAKPTRMGISMGRVDGRKGYFFFSQPTRGAENTSKACRFIADKPLFVNAPGPYDGVKSVNLAFDTQGYTIHFTLDGTEPTVNSRVYTEPIPISRTTIVRAFAEGDDNSLRSQTVTGTFFINAGHKLPIVSIVVNKADLYDFNTGIFQEGPGGGHATGGNPADNAGANYWAKNYERRAHISFYDGKEGFDEECGLKVYGGGSRELPKRSVQVKFMEKFGAEDVVYDIFNRGKAEQFNGLVLRGGSQDWQGVMMRDEFFTSLMASQSPNLLVMGYRPVALYINEEYYGLYYIREKVNKNYMQRHFGVGKDSLDMLNCRFVMEGSYAGFAALKSYAASHDLKQKEHYEYVRDRIDCEAFIDHFIGEFYASNSDLCNVRYMRSGDKKSDRKWHIMYYDLDETWHTFCSSKFYFSGNSSVFVHDIIIVKMLENPEFRRLFLERLSHHLHTTFSLPYVTKFFNNMVEVIRPEMVLNCQRWPNMTYKEWERNLETFSKNFETRPKAMLKDLRTQINITPEEEKKYFADLGY